MRFNPDAVNSLLPAGQYEGAVKRAEEKFSKSGSPMIELIVTVYAAGTQADIFDYLLSSDTWAWKVRHFCESAGLDFTRGELRDEQCLGRNVRVSVVVEKKPGYADRNVIKDYVLREGAAPSAALPQETAEFGGLDDDIPF